MRSDATTSPGVSEENKRQQAEAVHQEAAARRERRNKRSRYNQPGQTRGWRDGKCDAIATRVIGHGIMAGNIACSMLRFAN
jgi:hypothetical protein